MGRKNKRPKHPSLKPKSKVDKYLSKTSAYCARCGKDLLRWDINATVDHMVPKSIGGANKDFNYMPLCFKCNQYKADQVVYPACYYYQLNYDCKTINQANKYTKDFIENNYSYDDIKESPLLFNELLFSMVSVNDVMRVNLGWNSAGFKMFMDKVNKQQIEEEGLPVLDTRGVYDNIYKCYRVPDAKLCAVIQASVFEDVLYIKYHKVCTRRLLFNSIRKFLEEFSVIYLKNGIKYAVIEGTNGCMNSINDSDKGDVSEVFCKEALAIIDIK